MSALIITHFIFTSLHISVFILCGSSNILVSHESPWMPPTLIMEGTSVILMLTGHFSSIMNAYKLACSTGSAE